MRVMQPGGRVHPARAGRTCQARLPRARASEVWGGPTLGGSPPGHAALPSQACAPRAGRRTFVRSKSCHSQILRFVIRIAFCCVLHQCGNQDIHCQGYGLSCLSKLQSGRLVVWYFGGGRSGHLKAARPDLPPRRPARPEPRQPPIPGAKSPPRPLSPNRY